jgi:cell division protein FtsB
MCLATVEVLEREDEALKKEMEALSEHNHGLERANQK